MVVMGEVIVIVVVAVPVLAMPIVAMPIIIAMPCRAAMPSADFVASLTLKRGGSLRWIKPAIKMVCNHWSAQIPHRRLLSRLTEVWVKDGRQPQLF